MLFQKNKLESTALRLKSGNFQSKYKSVCGVAELPQDIWLPQIIYLIFLQNLLRQFIFGFYLYVKVVNLHPKLHQRKPSKDHDVCRVYIRYFRIRTATATSIARLETWCYGILYFPSLQKFYCDCKGHWTSWFIYNTMHK